MKISAIQMSQFAIWCRDYGQSIFDPMDPIDNPDDVQKNCWDSALKYCQEIGINFQKKKTLKTRMKRWYKTLKSYRDGSNTTGAGGKGKTVLYDDLSEPEKIFDDLWWGNKLGGQRSAKVRISMILTQLLIQLATFDRDVDLTLLRDLQPLPKYVTKDCNL